MKNGKYWSIAAVIALAFPGTHGFGQTTESTSDAADVYELSPFVVAGSEDSGYVATSSLAGTRIKTNLEDVGASISVVTKDMMTDLGVDNVNVLLNYTVGTEVAGSSGNFSGASTSPSSFQEDAVNRSFSVPTRVRGLGGADNTRDFFLTSVPWDGFNTERIDISRGPNSILFGTGSPAGIINMSPSKAFVDNHLTEILLKADNWGSLRAQIDHNAVILQDKLAVRVALKRSEDRFKQEEAFVDDKRHYAAMIYKPFELTSIRANYEWGRQDAAKPYWRPPFDNGIVSWFEAGMPAVNPLTGEAELLGNPTARFSGVNEEGRYQGANVSSGPRIRLIQGMLGHGGNNPALFFDQPDALGSTRYGLSGVNAYVNNPPPVTGSTGGALLSMSPSRLYNQQQATGLLASAFYGASQITDPRIFDFYSHMLDSNKKEAAKWKVFSAAFEQLTPNRQGGIEVAYMKEKVHSSFQNPFNFQSYGISVDINTHLLDGSVNPNFGRPMIASPSWSTETEETRESARLTAFYKVETKVGPEWLRRMLGTHTFTGNLQNSTQYSVTHGGRAVVAGPEWTFQNPRIYSRANPPYLITNGASREFTTAVYLGDRADTAQGMNIRPITVDVLLPDYNSVPVHYFHVELDQNNDIIQDVGEWRTVGVTLNRGTTFDKSSVDLSWTGGKSRVKSEAKVLVLHSSMFWDTILPTLGYREDKLKFYNAGTIVNPSNLDISKEPLPSVPGSVYEEDSFNWGLVARLPASIEAKLPAGLRPSIFYNKSDNFAPTRQRINMFGENIDPMKGETDDYGFMLTAFDNKLGLRLAKYETAITGQSVDMRGSHHRITREGIGNTLVNIEQGSNDLNPVARDAFLNWWASDPFARNIRETFEFGDSNRPSGTTDGRLLQTTDTISEGYEVEVTYNPQPNWRIALNISKTEVVNDNSARDFLEFIQEWESVMNTPVGEVWVGDPGLDVSNAQTLKEFTERSSTDVIRVVAADGQPANPELRKYRLNAFTNYTFTDGAFKNFSVGGAVRWADKVLIGTGFKVDDILGTVPDFANKHWGPSQTNFDAWVSYTRDDIYKNVDWKIQLNVRNIGVGNKLIPTGTQPDGTVRVWRIAEPMTVSISSEFSF